jgi:hypothetical protein
MSARAIVSGVLFREPVTKTSKSGNAYVLATVREGAGETARWWKAFIFAASAIEEVSRLGDGDPVSLAGEIDAQIYTPAGGEKPPELVNPRRRGSVRPAEAQGGQVEARQARRLAGEGRWRRRPDEGGAR